MDICHRRPTIPVCVICLVFVSSFIHKKQKNGPSSPCVHVSCFKERALCLQQRISCIDYSGLVRPTRVQAHVEASNIRLRHDTESKNTRDPKACTFISSKNMYHSFGLHDRAYKKTIVSTACIAVDEDPLRSECVCQWRRPVCCRSPKNHTTAGGPPAERGIRPRTSPIQRQNIYKTDPGVVVRCTGDESIASTQ